MLNYNLDSVQTAHKLVRLCEKYHDDMSIDVIHGRQTVDGCSLLGVASLVGNFVCINLICDNREKMMKFTEELESIKE